MEMPEVKKFLGIFPVKYGCFLIGLFGISLGAFICACVVLYAIAENIISTYFEGAKVDEVVKKMTLLPFGVAGLCLMLANALLLMGVSLKRAASVRVAVRVLFCMCVMMLLLSAAMPLSCFFTDAFCVVNKLSMFAMLCVYLVILLFVEIWMYCTVIAWNLEQKMS